MADSAGKGILIVAVCHGLAQLQARWDNAGAHAIWDTAGIKVILGGVTDTDTLEDLSRLCGEIALRTHSRTQAEDGRWARTITYQYVRVLPPELLRMLPEWRALVIRGNLSPVVIRLRMAWRRDDFHAAQRGWSSPEPPVLARTVALPELPQSGPTGTDDLAATPSERDGWFTDVPSQQPIPDDHVAAPQLISDEPQVSNPRPPQDAPPLSPPPDSDPQPGPRRPWHPPVNSGDRR
jgi:type IV secretory pathway TraG/TraD family ATPase VirD4